MFLNKCLINIIFFLFLIISKLSFSAITIEDIPRLGDDLLKGLLALESGLLENIRFKGNYGTEKSEYLCHYSLNEEQRTRDCPQDHTTAILHNIFPSPGGGTLGTINAVSDFFNKLKIDQVKKILDLYKEIKLNPNNTKNLDKFMKLNARARNGIIANWRNKFDSYDKLAEKYKEMFLGAAQEKEAYPNIVEYALLALAIKKANTVQDLKIFGVLDNQNIYDKNLYINFKNSYIKDNKLSSSDFKNLLDNDPKLFSFYLAGYKKYNESNKFPPILGENEQAVCNHTKFTACGETSLRNFLNVVAANIQDQTFNPDYLVRATQELKDFYSKQKSYDDLKSDDLRNDWASLVANKQEVKYQRGTYEISVGIDNMLKLVGNLLNDEGLKNIENITSQERANKVKYLFNKLSRDDFKISINVDKLGNIDNLNIFINGEEMFVWAFQGGHFYFKHINESRNSDWRAGHLDNLLNSNIDDNFKRLMGDFLNQYETITSELSNKERVIASIKISPYLLKQKDRHGNNIAQLYAKSPYVEVPDIILDRKYNIDINYKNYKGNTIMDIALTEQNNNIINSLLDKGYIYFNDQNKDGDTILHTIIKYRHSKRYYNMGINFLLVNKNVDVNMQNNNGNTPLHLGLLYNDYGITMGLLSHKDINIDLPNKNNSTPLDIAIKKYGDGIDSSLLLDTSKQDKFGDTALHLVANNNNNNDILLKFILLNNKNSNSINLQNINDNTALHVAINNKNSYIAKLFLKQENIDVNLQDKFGNTALHLALKKGYKEYKDICDSILSMNNINLNLQNSDGETPLHIALKKGYKTDIIEHILQNKNIDINLQDKNGNAALHLLALEYYGYENKKLLEKFLSYDKININLKNTKNKTALDLAEDERNYPIADSLRSFINSQKTIFGKE